MMGSWVWVPFIWGVSVAAVPAVAIEFIPKEQVKILSEEYGRARVPTRADIKGISGHELLCDMYGMRTRLQVERGVRLYMLVENSNKWQNQGAQVISEYHLENQGLIGRKGMMVDELRLNSKNEWIAQLSLKSADDQGTEKKQLVILAYSKCQKSTTLASAD